MSALVAWQRSPSEEQLTQVLHPLRKGSRHHTGLQTNVRGVILPCVFIVKEFSWVLTDNSWRQEDVVRIEALSLGGDILKTLVLLLACSVELWLKFPCAVSAEMSALLATCQAYRLELKKTHPVSLDLPRWTIIGYISKQLTGADVQHFGFKTGS